MNAKWLEKFIKYKETDFGKGVIQKIISQKIKNQKHLVEIRTKNLLEKNIPLTADIGNVFLIEAQEARKYWRDFRFLLPSWTIWQGRKPRNGDFMNKLLDIGYHFLTEYIKRRMEALDIPYEIGLLHKAQSKNSAPLAYDFMEWLRPNVDKILLSYLRQKKRPIIEIGQKHIRYFIAKIKKSLEHTYYHSKRKDCVSLSYWIDLMLLEFRGAVSEKREFRPIFPPYRHDTRCKNKTLPKRQS